jgi:hypothetical protein
MKFKDISAGIDAHVGKRRAVILAFALLILVMGGISIFHVPAYEIIYDKKLLSLSHSDGTRTVIGTLDIGNTGQYPQSVEIHLKPESCQNRIRSVTARNFGYTNRPVQRRDSDDALIYRIEDIEAEKQVEVRFVLRFSAGEPLPEWEDLLVLVKPEYGRALAGNPGVIKLLRFFPLFI